MLISTLGFEKFLSLGMMDILDWTVLCCGGCAVHCGMVTSIASILGFWLLPIDASGVPPSTPAKNDSRHCHWPRHMACINSSKPQRSVRQVLLSSTLRDEMKPCRGGHKPKATRRG